jgi:hypothetical protein
MMTISPHLAIPPASPAEPWASFARLQRRHQDLLDIGHEQFPVDCTIDDEWGGQAIAAQRADKGCRLPVSMRNGSDQALAAFCPAMASRHVGLHPGFIKENKLRWS